MSTPLLRSYISGLYIFSFVLSLTVFTLSLLDLGFGSLFLGIVGPCITFLHHGCTAFFLRKSATMSLSPLASTLSIFTVAVLSAVWFAGSTVVTVWGTFYMDGSVKMLAKVVGTPETIVAQGVVGVFESFVLISLFATLVCIRGNDRWVGIDEEKAEWRETSLPHLTVSPIIGRQPVLIYPRHLRDCFLIYPNFNANFAAARI